MGQSTPIFEASAAELSRNFGHWQDRAMQSPVCVTHHGRPRAVLMSIDEYQRLGAGMMVGASGALAGSAGGEKDLAGALRAMHHGMTEGFIALDDQLRITSVNPVVEAYLERTEAELLGQPVADLEGGERAAVFVDRFRWVLKTGEPASFVARTFLGGGDRTLSVRAFPYRHGVGVIYVNITQQEALKDQLSEIEAENAALLAHDDVGVGTLNMLGFFTRTNPGLRGLFGFSEAQFDEVRLIDLVRPAERQALARGLNGLLKFETDAFRSELELMARDGGRVRAGLSATRRMRDQVCAGFAVVLVTRPSEAAG